MYNFGSYVFAALGVGGLPKSV